MHNDLQEQTFSYETLEDISKLTIDDKFKIIIKFIELFKYRDNKSKEKIQKIMSVLYEEN